jgi:magnesium-protoporphyrin IX monomethyl ester (oxidative) cyclase
MSNRSIRRWESTHPSMLDTHHPEFFARLEQCAIANQEIAKISSSYCSPVIEFCRKLPWTGVIMWQLLRLLLLTIINAENYNPEIY